jgi:hypothetical protein
MIQKSRCAAIFGKALAFLNGNFGHASCKETDLREHFGASNW